MGARESLGYTFIISGGEGEMCSSIGASKQAGDEKPFSKVQHFQFQLHKRSETFHSVQLNIYVRRQQGKREREENI